jgi:hypothetical protein
MAKNLKEKFEKAMESFNSTASLNSNTDKYASEELMVWQKSPRKTLSVEEKLMLKITKETLLDSKCISLTLSTGKYASFYTAKRLISFLEDSNLKKIFGSSKDFCEFKVNLSDDDLMIEGYRLIEVGDSSIVKIIREALSLLKYSHGKTFSMIERNYGKNEAGIDVIIIGFQYQRSIYKKRRTPIRVSL